MCITVDRTTGQRALAGWTAVQPGALSHPAGIMGGMKSNTPIPCTHPEVVAVRKWNHRLISFVYRCTSCHQLVVTREDAA